MDYDEKKYLKKYKPRPDRLYFHRGEIESDSWSCCGKSAKCYLGRRGCKWIITNWGRRKPLVASFDSQKKREEKVGRLPAALLKEVISYL